ncbi:MAG: ABC transporter permease [Bryobacteraceae bacterium]
MSPNWNEFVRRRLPALGIHAERESEIVAELAEQMRTAYQEWIDAGHAEPDARRHAESQVKDWAGLASELRRAETPAPKPIEQEARGAWLTGLWHDIRYSFRWLAGNPIFAGVAILTLAFAIGGNTAIFTVVDHIALRGLPYPGSERLVSIEHTKPDQPEIDPWCSIDNMLEFRRRLQSLDAIAAISPVWNLVLTSGPETERLETLFVSESLFPMLGVKPHIGRFFTPEEDDRTRPSQVAILSFAFWKRRFGGSPEIVGRTITLDGNAVSVVGVLPEDFRWLGEPLAGSATNIEIWAPLGSNPLARSPRQVRFLKVIGQRKESVSMDQATEEVRRVGAALTTEFPEANKNLAFSGVPLERKVTGRLLPAVFLLLATVGFVLLMASANVANLLLARAAGRRREIAVRIALGASAGRLMRQLLTESFVLAILGGVAGVGLAYGFLRLIIVNGPPAIVQTRNISLDLRALLFTSAIVLLTAILAGVVPAWRAVVAPRGSTLREGRGTTHGNRRIRSALAVAQVMLAVVLLSGSGLLIRSFMHVLEIDPGFDPHNLVSIATQVPMNANSPQQRTNVYNRIREQLLATPGVQAVGEVSRLPMLGQNLTSLLEIEGHDSTVHPPEVEFRAASPSYFPTAGIPLVSGRLFDDRDSTQQLVLLIDDLTARRHFPGENPVGKRVRFLADKNGPWFEVVGVVGTIRHFGLEAEPRPTIYRPAAINPLNSPILLIRTTGDAAPMMQTLTKVVRTAYGSMPAYNVFSMEALVDRSTLERRFLMWLLSSFALAALFLSAIGVYGAIAQSVAQRTQEIGVRIALGASPRDTMRLVLGEGLWIAGAGVAAGIVLGLVLAKLGEGLLYGVQPYDVTVYTGSALTLFAAALLACYVPARRATRVDPLVTLRDV